MINLREASNFVEPIRAAQAEIRDAVVAACEEAERGGRIEELARVAGDDEGDTIYAVDRVGEERLVALFDELAREAPIVLVAEGLEGGRLVLPRGRRAAEARWRVLVDP